MASECPQPLGVVESICKMRTPFKTHPYLLYTVESRLGYIARR
jgi:hypothetical protein